MCRPGVGIGIGLLEAQHLLLAHPASSAEAAAHPTLPYSPCSLFAVKAFCDVSRALDVRVAHNPQ